MLDDGKYIHCRFRKEGNTIHNLALKESYNLDDPDLNPLEVATLLVQVGFASENSNTTLLFEALIFQILCRDASYSQVQIIPKSARVNRRCFVQEDLAIMQIDPKSKQYKLTAAAILFPMVGLDRVCSKTCFEDWQGTALQSRHDYLVAQVIFGYVICHNSVDFHPLQQYSINSNWGYNS